MYCLTSLGTLWQVLAERIAPASQPAWTTDGAAVFYLVESADTPGSRDGWEVPVRDGRSAGPPRRVAPVLATNLGFSHWHRDSSRGCSRRRRRTSIRGRFHSTRTSAAGPPVRIAPTRLATIQPPPGRLTVDGCLYFTTRAATALWQTPQDPYGCGHGSRTRHQVSTTLAFVADITPLWFPDGRSMVVWGSDQKRAERHGLHRIDLSSGRADALLVGNRLHPGAALSPDGRVLYDKRPPYQAVIARELDSGQEREVLMFSCDRVYSMPGTRRHRCTRAAGWARRGK